MPAYGRWAPGLKRNQLCESQTIINVMYGIVLWRPEYYLQVINYCYSIIAGRENKDKYNRSQSREKIFIAPSYDGT